MTRALHIITTIRRIWRAETPFWVGFWNGLNRASVVITVAALVLTALFLLVPVPVIERCVGQ